jgi:uncharacterized protein YbjQ (UPF0145 family)
VTDWDGRGLPPAAAERMERFHRHPIATSLFEVPDTVALASVGLSPVGEVMGCIVQHIGWQGYGGCGMYGGGYGGGFGGGGFGGGFGGRGPGGFSGYGFPGPTTVTSGQPQGGYTGYAPYVDAIYRGYGTALSRLGAEAHAMSADGVVGVKIVDRSIGEGNREFIAMGTAVRAASRTRPARMFVTDRGGPDVSKLMHAGWVPVNIAIGISVAIRHDDYLTRQQASSFSSYNTEVSGYTELVEYVRADARQRFDAAARADGADAATVSDMTLNISEMEPGEGHRDHIAECRVIGNSIARFHKGLHAISSTLTVLPLNKK